MYFVHDLVILEQSYLQVAPWTWGVGIWKDFRNGTPAKLPIILGQHAL